MLCAFVGVVAVAACDGPQLVIVLKPAQDLIVRPDFVKVIMGDGKNPIIEKGPFGIDAIPDSIFAEIPPATPFFIDVIGCSDSDIKNCQDPLSFTARGCTENFVSINKDQPRATVSIFMHKVDVGNSVCPPEGSNEPPFTGGEGEGEGAAGEGEGGGGEGEGAGQ